MLKLIFAAALSLVISLPSLASSASTVAPDWSVVEKRLKSAGLKKSFIEALKANYEPEDFQNVVELNLLLFLRKTDDHGVQVTDDAVDRVRGFLTDHDVAFRKAEREHAVPGPVIASLLWIESRYGKNLGRFNVASIFCHLLQAERVDVLKHLKGAGAKRFKSKKLSKREIAKIDERTSKKAKWALQELKALQRIYRSKGPIAVEIRGSFAGAFGMAQFLPSSYSRWAKAMDSNAVPDLGRPEDAIQSVAYYLNQNGWKTKKTKTHVRALMNYNNSSDYANAILKLAAKADRSSLAVDDSKEKSRGPSAD